MLTGENGIIKQATNAKDATDQARVEELVDLAVNALITENEGSTNGITPQMIADEVNETEGREDIYPEGSTFPTKIIFPEEKREVEVNIEQNEEIYSADISEEDIAPTDLFDYEIIDKAEIGAIENNSLPTKTARITGIKEEYCNSIKGTGDTNYEIIYEGSKISDTLIIPYKVELDGEMYRITEVNIQAPGTVTYGIPRVETIIYPNTVEKIYGKTSYEFNDLNSTLKTIIFSNNLKVIGEYSFCGCGQITNINIPESVTTIEHGAFSWSRGNTNITIPKSVINVGNEVFRSWTSSQTINVPFKEEELPAGWSENWKGLPCYATINYLK